MRKKTVIKKHPVKPDKKYSSPVVAKLINKVMKNGEKRKARKIVYQAAEIVEKKTSLPFLTVLSGVLENAKIGIEMKSRRIGGGKYRVPNVIDASREEKKTLNSLKVVARDKETSTTMSECLAEVVVETYNKTGEVIKRKENILKEAEGSRALA
jgi:small subunit ribosomal protein S7